MNSVMLKFSRSLRTRHGYLRFYTLGWGLPFALVMGLPYISTEPLLTVVYLVLSPLGGYAGGVVMWNLFQRDRVLEDERVAAARKAAGNHPAASHSDEQ